MVTRKTCFTFIVLATMLFSISAKADWWWPFSDKKGKSNNTALTELTWEDLIPNDFVQPENPFASMSQEAIDKLMDGSEESNAEMAKLQEAYNYSPVVNELDGKRVKIPAYITPLDYGAESKIKEFLLVPYVGACMHVPPPPSNQIVHAKSPEAINYPGMYDPVWAIGTIRTVGVKSALAESGYQLEVEEIQAYTRE